MAGVGRVVHPKSITCLFIPQLIGFLAILNNIKGGLFYGAKTVPSGLIARSIIGSLVGELFHVVNTSRNRYIKILIIDHDIIYTV